MCSIVHAHSRDIRSPEWIKAIGNLFGQQETFDAIVDHLIYKELLAKVADRMGAGMRDNLSRATLREAIANNHGLVKNAMTDLNTKEWHSKILRTNKRLEAVQNGLVKNTV